MSGSLHELLRVGAAAVVQEEKLDQPVNTHTHIIVLFPPVILQITAL